jgi:hypothetical protein
VEKEKGSDNKVIGERKRGGKDVDGDEGSEVEGGGTVENVGGRHVKRVIGCSRAFARVHEVEDERVCESYKEDEMDLVGSEIRVGKRRKQTLRSTGLGMSDSDENASEGSGGDKMVVTKVNGRKIERSLVKRADLGPEMVSDSNESENSDYEPPLIIKRAVKSSKGLKIGESKKSPKAKEIDSELEFLDDED